LKRLKGMLVVYASLEGKPGERFAVALRVGKKSCELLGERIIVGRDSDPA
jgi:hypothetical protein